MLKTDYKLTYLINENLKLQGHLNTKNKIFYDKLLKKVRLMSIFKDSIKREEYLLHILKKLLHEESKNKSFEDIFGNNIDSLSRNIVNELPLMKKKRILTTFLSVLILFLFPIFIISIAFKENLHIGAFVNTFLFQFIGTATLISLSAKLLYRINILYLFVTILTTFILLIYTSSFIDDKLNLNNSIIIPITNNLIIFSFIFFVCFVSFISYFKKTKTILTLLIPIFSVYLVIILNRFNLLSLYTKNGILIFSLSLILSILLCIILSINIYKKEQNKK